jgi:hypothetical protein
MLLLICQQACPAESVSEGRVIAAYVLNFAKFVEWPAESIRPDNRITLCVIGNNVLDGALSELDTRKVGIREIRVVSRVTSDTNFSDCQLLYIGQSERKRVAAILRELGDSSVLSISNLDDFAEKGGGIGLLHHQDRIIFEVNLLTIQRQNLRIPAQLLKLASRVFGR